MNSDIMNFMIMMEKKVTYKTKVLQSSDKMKKESKENSLQGRSNKEPKIFCWDNLDKFYEKEAKKALKGNSEDKANFFALFTKALNNTILNRLDYDKLSKAFIIFCITFILQIIISKKARRWSLSLMHFLLFTGTSLGLGGTLYFLLKKKELKSS